MSNRKKSKPSWCKKTFKLPETHGWTASPGHNVFVADQGAVRLEYPQSWIVAPVDGDISIGIYDAQPPDDNVRLAISVMHLPQQVDWSELPLEMLLKQVYQARSRDGNPRNVDWQADVHIVRGDVEVAWMQGDFIDPAEQRRARTRASLARGGHDYIVQALLTMDYWLTDAARFEPVWDHALRSLRLGVIIPNPITHRDR
jgi:hypothetical protein